MLRRQRSAWQRPDIESQLRGARRRCYSHAERNAVMIVEAHGPHCHHCADAARDRAGARRAGATGGAPPAASPPSDTAAPPAAAPAESNPPAPAEQNPAPPPAAGARAPSDADLRESVCLMIEASARANNLPLEFFARVIWQESRFQPGVVGPRTRSGERAQGIAQFMPRTAAERGLLDPFDPVQALPKSAEFLRELADQFGNLGLAAAAYNAGPQRVRDWLSGRRTLPAETQQLRARHHRALGRRVGAQRQARAGAAGAAELHAADGAAASRAQSVRAEARGAGESRGRQPVGRAAQRRVLARPGAVELRDAGQALCRGADRTRPEPAQQRVPQPRHPAVLPGAGRAPTRARRRTASCGSIRRAGGACIVLRNGAS